MSGRMVLAVLAACAVGGVMAVATSTTGRSPSSEEVAVCAGAEWYLRRAAYDRDEGGSVVQPVARPALEQRADQLAVVLKPWVTTATYADRIEAERTLASGAWDRAFETAEAMGQDEAAVLALADACEAKLKP